MIDRIHNSPGGCVMVVFGASGDLASTKIAPALCSLRTQDLLPESFRLIGYARSDFTTDSFRERIRQSLEDSRIPDSAGISPRLQEFIDTILYCRGDYDNAGDLERLAAMVTGLEREMPEPHNRLFYCAVPPQVVMGLVESLCDIELLQRRQAGEEAARGFHRVLLEKPFGSSYATACELNDGLRQHMETGQIYRMDHYLAKETVQNIMVLRFANAIFEPVWNNRYVKNVHVTVAESDGIGDRAKYFESSGALRDVMQNHVLQLLALFAMEPPVSTGAAAVRAEKAKLLGALAPLSDEDLRCSVIRGQYGPGFSQGEKVPGYRQEGGVAADSCTETFAAVRARINNWRWSGVPFYLSTGKRLARKLTEVAVEFKDVPHKLFGGEKTGLEPNMLVIQVQPEERVSMRITTKVPGFGMKLSTADMDLPYSARFTGQSPEAYERLLLDAINGDPSLFAGSEEIELSWKYVDPILEFWQKGPKPAFPNYSPGAWGPIEGKDFFREDVCYAELKTGI